MLVDPKMVEFAPYKPLLRHYLAAMPDTDPEQIVITDCDRVINTLNSLVIEMENRYKPAHGCRRAQPGGLQR